MMELDEAFGELAAALDKMELRFAVAGSMASATFGVPRATQDIDLVVDLSPDEAFELATLLKTKFAVDPHNARESIRLKRPFNLMHAASVSKFDIFPATSMAHGQEELRRRLFVECLPLSKHDDVPMVSPEDIILAKLAWFRTGNGVSERQWQDIESVWDVCGPELDRAYLSEWAGKMGTADLLARLVAREQGI